MIPVYPLVTIRGDTLRFLEEEAVCYYDENIRDRLPKSNARERRIAKDPGFEVFIDACNGGAVRRREGVSACIWVMTRDPRGIWRDLSEQVAWNLSHTPACVWKPRQSVIRDVAKVTGVALLWVMFSFLICMTAQLLLEALK